MSLRVVPPPADAPAGDPFGNGPSRRRAPGRPGDVPEPWHLPASAHLRRLAALAVQSALHLDTALALIVERELLRSEIDELGLPASTLGRLDAAARDARVDRRLTGADAVYLRSLRCGAVVS